MMYSPMKSVAEFHDKFHRDGVDRHERSISVSIINSRLRLIAEEFEEVVDAMEDVNTTIGTEYISETVSHLAKELADLLYVVYGTAEELDLPLEEVFKAVHNSNMGKVWPDGLVHYNDFGKVIKPPTYSPPNIMEILYAE